MKRYTKELIAYAIAAFLVAGIPIQIGTALLSDVTINGRSVCLLLLVSLLCSLLMTLLKYIFDRRRQ